jgi:prophage endopeptidase
VIRFPGKGYVYGAVALAWLVSVIGVGWWQNRAGVTSERLVWQKRSNVELASVNAEILRLTEKARLDERRHNDQLAAAAAFYEQEKKRALEAKDRAIADLRAGALRLRDPHATACPSSPGTAGGATTSPGERDGGAPGRLSREAAEFLLGEATRANEVVHQLAACQAVVRSDRARAAGP